MPDVQESKNKVGHGLNINSIPSQPSHTLNEMIWQGQATFGTQFVPRNWALLDPDNHWLHHCVGYSEDTFVQCLHDCRADMSYRYNHSNQHCQFGHDCRSIRAINGIAAEDIAFTLHINAHIRSSSGLLCPTTCSSKRPIHSENLGPLGMTGCTRL